VNTEQGRQLEEEWLNAQRGEDDNQFGKYIYQYISILF